MSQPWPMIDPIVNLHDWTEWISFKFITVKSSTKYCCACSKYSPTLLALDCRGDLAPSRPVPFWNGEMSCKNVISFPLYSLWSLRKSWRKRRARELTDGKNPRCCHFSVDFSTFHSDEDRERMLYSLTLRAQTATPTRPGKLLSWKSKHQHWVARGRRTNLAVALLALQTECWYLKNSRQREFHCKISSRCCCDFLFFRVMLSQKFDRIQMLNVNEITSILT